ncbi:MAG: hypothetical protein ABIG68_09510 [Acidobacteriota bacterium]
MKRTRKTSGGSRRNRATTRFRAAAWPVLIALAAGEAWAAGGKPATQLVNVADTRGMSPGLSKWLADLYNTDLWLFGLAVVLIMAAMGYVLGSGFDKLMSLVGINLGRLEHHE